MKINTTLKRVLEKIFLFVLIISFFSSCNQEQKNSEATLISSFTTNFELVNNLIFVKVTLNGKEENFILDSGAPEIVLNSTYFKSKNSGVRAKGVSGITILQNIEIESFDWNGISLENTKLIGMDLSHLEEQTGRKFKGLIGFSVLQKYELLIDYKKCELTLFSQGKSKWHTKIKPKTEFSFEYGAHIPIIEITIRNNKYKLGIDTGASSNLLNQDSYAALPKSSYIKEKTSNLYGADKTITKASIIKIKTSKISNKKFIRMEFVISNISHLNEGYGLNIDGLLGYPFLSEQKTSIDFLNKKIYYWK